MAVRYTIIVVLFVSISAFLLGGYWHATRRMRKGLAPLPYHAWMVRRRAYRPQQHHQQPQAYYQPYTMHGYPQNSPPPPAYNPYSAPPPAYQPPEGASKVLADQQAYAQAQTRREQEQEQGPSSAVTAPPSSAAAWH